MGKPVVSIVKAKNVYESLKEALDLCDGLAGFKPEDKVLIKPNIVAWDYELPYPPYGVVTTSAVVSALVQILAEKGIEDITIGEGGVPDKSTDGVGIFRTLGYGKLEERYGVKLVDFNQDEYETVDHEDGFKLNIAKQVLKADKVINVPVMKTHNIAKVSLGIKNLKGALDKKSKQFCHGEGDRELSLTFPRIIEKVPVALTIVDGIYMLEKGPGHTGRAFRKNLLLASTDPFACDIVGAAMLGYEPESLEWMINYAKWHGYSLDLADYEVRGETIEAHKEYVDFDWEWTKDDTGPAGFEKRGITGLAIRKYDSTLCTFCAGVFNPMLILFSSAFKGQPFPNVEVVSGKKQKAAEGFDLSVLFGKCACHYNKDNPNIKKAIKLWGCPPDNNKLVDALAQEGINCNFEDYIKFRHYLFDRYVGKEGFDLSNFTLE